MRFLLLSLVILPLAAADKPVSFSKDIQPVLENSCWKCHGSAIQLSKLDLRTREAVEAAAEKLAGAARATNLAARIDGFLVQEMVAGVEAIVGARTDPLYGPILLVGAGGVLVELAKDAAVRI